MPIVVKYSTRGSLTQIFCDFFSPPDEQQFGVLAPRLPQLISGPGTLVTLVFYLQFAIGKSSMVIINGRDLLNIVSQAWVKWAHQ
jgi:hypothetical protein